MEAWATEVVSRGSAILDNSYPQWESKIDAASLDIANGEHCICGQLYGHFWKGLLELGLATGLDYGFAVPMSYTTIIPDQYKHNAEILNAAWRDEIAKRRLSKVEVNDQSPALSVV